MGKIDRDPISTISSSIVSHKHLSQFIETGTYRGSSLPWALSIFDSIITIEINEEYFNSVKEAYNDSRIKFLLGDSRYCLSIEDLSTSSLIWLDAHSGGGKYGSQDDCPLVAELAIIMKSTKDHYIMIDDARAFCWPLSKPFDYSKWPTLNDIFSLVGTRYWVSYISDTLILIPKHEKEEFQLLFSQL